MYGKIFSDIFDSSLMADGGWLPTYVFMSMISLADKDGLLRHDPRTLYRKLGFNETDAVTFNDFMNAVEFLEEPDEFSNIDAKEGRRIVGLHKCEEIQGDRGWAIVNYAHYRDKGGSLEKRREQDALRKRRERERKNNNLETEPAKCHVTVTGGHVMSAHKDIDTDTLNNSPNFDEFWTRYPRKEGKAKAEKAFKNLAKKDKTALIEHMPKRLKHESFDQPKKFIPLPATFINGRRWEDELTAEVKSNLSNIRDLQL